MTMPIDTSDFGMAISLQTLFKAQFAVTYRGVAALRCPFDYVIYQMIVAEVKPDLIIEIGTNEGGGAYYLADLQTLLGGAAVHTIDILNAVNPIVLRHPKIKFFGSGWQGYDLEKETAGFRNILVIDDGSHTYEDTLSCLKKFTPKVALNSYFIVEDGIVSDLRDKQLLTAEQFSQYNGGPLRAIKEYLETDNSLIIDKKWSNLFGKNATFNVDGYLKKVA